MINFTYCVELKFKLVYFEPNNWKFHHPHGKFRLLKSINSSRPQHYEKLIFSHKYNAIKSEFDVISIIATIHYYWNNRSKKNSFLCYYWVYLYRIFERVVCGLLWFIIYLWLHQIECYIVWIFQDSEEKKNYTKGSKFCIKKILKKNSLDQQKNPSNFFFLPNDFSFDFSAILVFLLFHLPFSNNLLFFSLPAVKNRKVLRWKAFLCSRFMRF